ncbi:hypothetical protein ACIPX0_16020 [Streptomyces sp. NPDC090075]|uniref:hypothetical protein n=1 Tax=unclassified Streptomyces TaxID=2593676 RepID=UPI003806ADBC
MRGRAEAAEFQAVRSRAGGTLNPAEGGDGATDLWVRVGNATKRLHGDDLLGYAEEHRG